MKLAITTISAILAVIPATLAQDAPTLFRLVTVSSCADLNMKSVNASNLQWWVNKDTASYCPDVVQPNCPAGNDTSVAGGNETLSMNVEVPGGQLVYVTPTGIIKYTQAHSAALDPPDSTTTGWHLQAPVTRGFGQLTWSNGNGGSGFVACPSTDYPGSWSIQTVIPGVDLSGCESVDLLVPMLTETGDFGVRGPGAWQYT